MKKVFCAMLICLATSAFIFAQTAVESETTEEQVTPAAEQGTEAETDNEPITFSADKVELAPEQKIGWPITLNIIPGFGIGSFVQHDKIGGWVGVGLSTVAITSTIVGGAFILNALVGSIFSILFYAVLTGSNSDETNNAADDMDAYVNAGFWLVGIGIGLELTNIVWGIVRPISFRKAYNASHETASAIKPTFTIAPIIAPDTYGAVAVVRY